MSKRLCKKIGHKWRYEEKNGDMNVKNKPCKRCGSSFLTRELLLSILVPYLDKTFGAEYAEYEPEK